VSLPAASSATLVEPAGRPIRLAALPRVASVEAVAVALVALLALVIRLAFDFRAPPFVTNDSLSYLLPGYDLVHGSGFAPILKRPPFYSLLVGGVIALFGEDLRALMLVQHLFGVGTVLLTYGIGRLVFGPVAGLLAALLTALSGPLIVTDHYLMSEALFGLLLAGGLFAYLRGVRSGRLGWLAAAGVLLGLAALTRPIAQLILVLLIVALPLFLPRWRPTLRGALVLAVLFAVTVLPWMIRNQVVQGTFAIAGGSGEGLAVRTIRYEQKFDFREPPGGDPDRQMVRARRIYRDEAEDGSAFELARRLREELNVSEVEAERLMRTISLQAILQQPGYYLLGTADMFLQTLIGRPVRLRQDWLPWRGIVWDERVEPLLPAPTPAEDRDFAVAERLVTLYDPARVAVPLVALMLVGIAAGLMPAHRGAPVLGAMVLGVLLAGAALIGIEWRYRYPLDPAINVLAAGGLTTLVGLVTRRIGRRV
jgi:4-amino-4-deoxy-L-arabinose transferase-like glycosyltransferase